MTPELKKPKSGEEKKLAEALKSKLIKDASLEEIKEMLRFVMVKIGMRAQNWPNDLEKVILHQHIVENFGGNNLEEIRLAFEMGIAGKLRFHENESIVPFENFSCLYFSSVMNAYRNWSSEAYNQVKKEVEVKLEQKIFSQEELDDSAREDVERNYQMFLRRIELKNIDINKSILFKDGLISLTETVFEFFTRKALAGLENIYKRQ